MAKISVNQLAKFLVSNSAQHRAIIKAQIEDNSFMSPYYRDAQKAITDFLLDPSKNEDGIIRIIDYLENSPSNSDYEKARLNNNIEALDSFLTMYDEVQYLEGCSITGVGAPCPKVTINDVEISVFPECVISGTYRKNNVVGAVKLYFSKPDPLTVDMAATVAVLTKKFLEENCLQIGSVRNQICQVIDVFAKTVHTAPSSSIRKIGEISAACEEIKFWWHYFKHAIQVQNP